MKNHYFLNRILILIILSVSWCVSKAQSSSSTHPGSSAVIYRWHNTDPSDRLSTMAEYKNLTEADYTPEKNNIHEWSAAKDLQSFASGLSKKLTVLYMLSVDEAGHIRSLKVIKTSDKSAADALSALIVNTRIPGPSYSHNKAVTSYVPCSISINNNQITIL